jgi:hypothetical protein
MYPDGQVTHVGNQQEIIDSDCQIALTATLDLGEMIQIPICMVSLTTLPRMQNSVLSVTQGYLQGCVHLCRNNP